ncbi:MAG: exodeoxyribonuclease V subunit gamma [Methylococcales bacterium]|nr:exodeoxyribonuclease V subunit gamma [Methylococcales bacterium]
MINLYHSNRLEALFEQLVDTIEQKTLNNVFEAETIIVQSQGMSRWLSMQLATKQSIAANIEYPFPASFVWKIFQSQLQNIPDNTSFDKDILVWKIIELLPRHLDKKEFSIIQQYLTTEYDEFKLYQLACKIVDIFDQYMVFRPDWIMNWESGNDEHWQAQLWRAIVENKKLPHRANVLHDFIEQCQQGQLNNNKLPERLSIFGISALPPAHLEVFNQISEQCDVHLFMLNPCLQFWGDIITKKSIVRIKQLRKLHCQSMSLEHYSVGHPLLASMGQLGKDFQQQLHQYDCLDQETYVEPTVTNLLEYIQTDILYLLDRQQVINETNTDNDLFEQTELPFDKALPIIEDSDNSLQIHCCHSPLREIEVLHDQLLALFEQTPSLKPHNIIVMTPDINDYIPYIEAVFGTSDHYLPWSIADRSVHQEHEITPQFFQLLNISHSRFNFSDIFSLLDSENILKRFQLNKSAISRLKNTCQQAGIRWGEDGHSKQAFDCLATDENTWQFGLERLLLGIAMPDTASLFNQQLPYPVFSSSEAEEIGKLQHFIRQLSQLRQKLSINHSALKWNEVLQSILNHFFEEDDQNTSVFQLLRDIIIDISDQVKQADHESPICLKVMQTHLTKRIDNISHGNRFMTGQITFCTMLPMRSIPFKVVCLMGLNDGKFPRINKPTGFDLMANNQRLGDRSKRQDDRYLFLECLLSARQTFYISYIGRNIIDNTLISPSSLVNELTEYIIENFALNEALQNNLITEHPLQPFNTAYFEASSNFFSYANEWLFQNKNHPEKIKTLPSIPPTNDFKQVELDDLIQFYKHPVKYFFIHRLGVQFNENRSVSNDTEPFSLDNLESYLLNQSMLEQIIDGHKIEQLGEHLKASGRLPYDEFGQNTVRHVITDIAEFNRIQQQHQQNAIAPLMIDLSLDDLVLHGQLSNLTHSHLLQSRYADLKPQDYLQLWIKHLVLLCQLQNEQPKISIHLAKKQQLQFNEVDNPEQYLQQLLKFYWQGLSQPLNFFPKSSFKYIEQKHKGNDHHKALYQAEQVWQGGVSPEFSSPYYHTLYHQKNSPIDDDFTVTAETLLNPIFDHLQTTTINF